ncbi:MAG: DUF6152 family protein [Pseudomonadota bacterium]
MKVSLALRVLGAALGFALYLPTAWSHHSVAGQFDVGKTVKITGTVSRMDWINPHTQVYLDVKDSKGVVTWKLESLPVAMMRKAGLSKQLVIGDGQEVVVTLHPARNGTEHLGYILSLQYKDGRTYQFSRDPNGTATASGGAGT